MKSNNCYRRKDKSSSYAATVATCRVHVRITRGPRPRPPRRTKEIRGIVVQECNSASQLLVPSRLRYEIINTDLSAYSQDCSSRTQRHRPRKLIRTSDTGNADLVSSPNHRIRACTKTRTWPDCERVNRSNAKSVATCPVTFLWRTETSSQTRVALESACHIQRHFEGLLWRRK